MKRAEVVLKGFGDAVPVACGMIACCCAMMTAYQIEFIKTPLILFCVFAALLLSFWMNLPKYGLAFGATYALCVGVIFVFCIQKVGDGAIALVYRLLDELPKELSGIFDMGRLANAAARVADPTSCITVFLIMIAAVTGFMLAFSLIRSKMVLLPLLIPLPLLLVSLVYTNRTPALWTMLLLSVYIGYALLGNGLRKGDMKRRGLFSVILAPTLLAFALLIIAIFPRSGYEPLSPERRKAFFSEQFGSIVDTVMSWFGERNPRQVDLSDEGERDEDETQVFTLYARTGTYLLRTHSYGAYENNRWKAADKYKGKWNSMEALGTRQEKADATMWIFDSIAGERIVPYAWRTEAVPGSEDGEASKPSAGESFVRSGGWKDYAWRYTWQYRTRPGNVSKNEQNYYEKYAQKQYVMPDGEEKQALLDILEKAGIVRSSDALETARKVAAFVRDSGDYSLTPGTPPDGQDFVLYFLTENRKGYCVHFASATTALLQALGYPARYTVGYYAEIPEALSNKGMPVTRNDEHAWTEVYVLGVGWVPVESTPGHLGDRGLDSARQSGEQKPQTTAAPTSVPTFTPTPAPTEIPEPTPGQTPETTEQPDDPEQPTPAPQPQTGTNDPTENGEGGAKPRGSAWWLLIPLVPLGWVGTGLLIRRRREARFRDPNVRKSIPDMAHYLKQLQRFGVKPDAEAEEWATEAAFSNHRMKTEHRTLLKRVHTVQKTLYAEKPVLRFLLRWVLYRI